MPKLTKKQAKNASDALSALNRATAFIMSDSVTICRRDSKATNTLQFTRQPVPECLQNPHTRHLGNYALTEIAKDIGSELCLLDNARKALEYLLPIRLTHTYTIS